MASGSPLIVKVLLDALVIGAFLVAVAGRPPRRRRSERLISAIGAAGVSGFVMGVLDWSAGFGGCESLLGPSVLAMCLARWLARAKADGNDGDGGSEVDHDGPPPTDWDAFDREREEWSRPRVER